MRTLTLNDGTILENSYVLMVDGSLFVYTNNGYNIKYVFDILYNPVATEHVTAFDVVETTYEGYTKLVAVRDEGNGFITAVLKHQTD